MKTRLTQHYYALLLCVVSAGSFMNPACAQTNISLDLHQYAGLTITGAVGGRYAIQYVTELSDTNQWITLTNIALPSSPFLFTDATSAAAARRFYRTVQESPGDMVCVPEGVFVMGDTFNEGADSEHPAHGIHVSAFYLDRHEVTGTLWEQVYTWAITNGYQFDHAGASKAGDHPVHTVSWFDAVKWCNARSEMAGLSAAYWADAGLTSVYRTGRLAPYGQWAGAGYRLPTEAEWELAARGGDCGRRFSGDDGITQSRANYYSDSSYAYDESLTRGFHPDYDDAPYPYTSPAGSFPANAFGLHDLTGNLKEWCWDWFDRDWYESAGAIQANTRGPASSPVGTRVIRGGSWYDFATNLRCASRNDITPDGAGSSVGFRCARDL